MLIAHEPFGMRGQRVAPIKIEAITAATVYGSPRFFARVIQIACEIAAHLSILHGRWNGTLSLE